jgi:hypothetical protein
MLDGHAVFAQRDLLVGQEPPDVVDQGDVVAEKKDVVYL